MLEPDHHASTETAAKDGTAASGHRSLSPSRSFRPRLSSSSLVTPTDENDFDHQAPVGLEAVVVGHLPSRAGPWVAQYARALSEHLNEPVGLVRLASDRLSLDVVGIGLDDGIGESSSFAAAAASIGNHVGAWLIAASDLAEPELCLDPRIARVTLLCTNDDSGVLATYRTIRQLMAWDTTPRAIAVAPLGVEVQNAEALWTRLREATKELLDGNLELAAFVERMGPTGAAAVYWTDTPEPLDQILDALEQATNARSESAKQPEQPNTKAANKKSSKASTRRKQADADAASHTPPETLPEDAPPAARIEPKPAATAAPVFIPAPAATPAEPPAVALTTAAPSSSPAASAAGSIAELIPGITRLPSVCPIDPAIELAVDQLGQLQLVLQDEPERAAYRLHAAARWVRLNGAYIIQTAGPLASRIDPTREPTIHLVVKRGVLAEPALALDWKVHLLIERISDGMSLRMLETLRS